MATKANLPRRGGAVRLTLSARVANDIGALERTLKSLAERLGHPACATGCDTFLLQLERDFIVNDKVALNPQPLPPGGRFGLPSDPDPMLPQDPVPIRVIIPAKVSDDIESLQAALVRTLGKLGCDACCSGFDILFQRERDLLAFDDSLELRGFGRHR